VSAFGGPAARLATIALASLAAVGAGLVSQHVYDMQPCPWCALQRLIFVVIALCALVGLAWRSPLGRRVGSASALLMALAGVATALWHHYVAAASASCNLTFADRVLSTSGLDALLPQVFAPMASCADAKSHLAGIPYELWALALYLVLAAVALGSWRRSSSGASFGQPKSANWPGRRR
jgi:disulfide bond formation protein DsbB